MFSIPDVFLQIHDFAKVKIVQDSARDFHIQDKIINIVETKEIGNQT